MARPKKEGAPDEEKTITIPYKDYLHMQNFLAEALQATSSTSHGLFRISSILITWNNKSMAMVQNNVKNALHAHDIDEDSIPQQSYPHLKTLLNTDKSLLEQALPGGETGDFGTMARWMGGGEAPKKPKKQKKPRDPNAPKRPVTAFFLYLQENKDATAREMPPDTKPGDVQARNRELWNDLSKDEQEKYKQKYQDNFAKYKQDLKDYQAKGGQIEETELEPDEAHAMHQKDSSASGSSSNSSDSDSESSEDEKPRTPTPPPPPKEKKSSKKGERKVKDASPEKSVKKKVKADSPPEVRKGKGEVEKDKKRKYGDDDGRKKKKRKSQAGDD